MRYFIFVFIFLASVSSAQYFRVYGSVNDETSGKSIPFATVRVSGTNLGTVTNSEGMFQLNVPKGKYLFVASYIGYISDSIEINTGSNSLKTIFLLKPSPVKLPEIVVMPTEDPAYEIIRNAIRYKFKRNSLLTSYTFNAFTKGVIKTTQDIGDAASNDNSISVGLPAKDTGELKITGILENESKGIFKSPDMYKEFIIARKQSANFPASINMLTGGRILQDFYSENINFFNSGIPGPLADVSASYYNFILEDHSAIDNKLLYKIRLFTKNEYDPGFTGYIYIADSTFELIKFDVILNRAANKGGIFDTIKISQSFSSFEGISMPVDYMIGINGNILGLIKIGFELNTILYDYEINKEIRDSQFDNAILTVRSDADKKDSLYWVSRQTIANTEEEKASYKRIDSLSRIEKSFWDRNSLLSESFMVNDNISFSAPLGLYRFNRIEGHTLKFQTNFTNLFESRFSFNLEFAYGFSDDKPKSILNSSYKFGEYRDGVLQFSIFNKLKPIFSHYKELSGLTVSSLSFLTKEEHYDYYYSSGFDVNYKMPVFSFLDLKYGASVLFDYAAQKNSDFGLFGKGKTQRDNLSISETKLYTIELGFTVDPRKYIEDGMYRRKIGTGSFQFLFGLELKLSPAELSGENSFTLVQSNLKLKFPSFNSAFFNLNLFSFYNSGNLPFQMMNSVPANLKHVSGNNTFRTLEIDEAFGDRTVYLFAEHQFGNELFKLLRIGFLAKSEVQLGVFCNTAITDISNDIIFPNGVIPKLFKSPFVELGFSLSHFVYPIGIDFAWRLNYKDESTKRFRIGIFSQIEL